VEHVAANQHQIGRNRDALVDGARERRRDISFALIDPGGGLPLVLAEPEVEVGKMDEAHAGKNLRAATDTARLVQLSRCSSSHP
jgi:hypothetical protein